MFQCLKSQNPDFRIYACPLQDGATVKIYYESRLAKINLSEEGRKLVSQLVPRKKQFN